MDELLDYLERNDDALSRTVRTGEVNLGTNAKKRPPPITDAKLITKVSENRGKALALICTLSRRGPDQWFDFYSALILIAYQALDGLAVEGLLRRWEYDPKKYKVATTEHLVSPEEIPQELYVLAQSTFSYLKTAPANGLKKVIAGLEWDLGIGPIHPFYDACGRISRYFSSLVCLWSRQTLPIHSSREEYMAAAGAGRDQFIEYWLARPTKFIGLAEG